MPGAVRSDNPKLSVLRDGQITIDWVGRDRWARRFPSYALGAPGGRALPRLLLPVVTCGGRIAEYQGKTSVVNYSGSPARYQFAHKGEGPAETTNMAF